MLSATFPVETELDLRTVPRSPSSSGPGDTEGAAGVFCERGPGARCTSRVERATCRHFREASLFIVSIIFSPIEHAQDSKRVSWDYWAEEISPAPNPGGSSLSPFTAASEASGPLPWLRGWDCSARRVLVMTLVGACVRAAQTGFASIQGWL